MHNKTSRILGTIFIIIGALFLLKNLDIMKPFFNVFDIGRLWPSLFLLIPGLLFHFGYFNGRRKDPGLLVPGGILLVLGIIFQINMLFGLWDVLFPLYIFSVAFGLFELYYFGNRERGLLVPVFILGAVSFVLFASFSFKALLGYSAGKVAIPVVLIVIGLYVISGGKRNRNV